MLGLGHTKARAKRAPGGGSWGFAPPVKMAHTQVTSSADAETPYLSPTFSTSVLVNLSRDALRGGVAAVPFVGPWESSAAIGHNYTASPLLRGHRFFLIRRRFPPVLLKQMCMCELGPARVVSPWPPLPLAPLPPCKLQSSICIVDMMATGRDDHLAFGPWLGVLGDMPWFGG
jgi:hypothetical protein